MRLLRPVVAVVRRLVALDFPVDRASVPPQPQRHLRHRHLLPAHRSYAVSFRLGELAVLHGRYPFFAPFGARFFATAAGALPAAAAPSAPAPAASAADPWAAVAKPTLAPQTELAMSAMSHRDLRDQIARPGLPPLYVGYTGKPVDVRFAEHAAKGPMSARVIRAQGCVRLRPDLALNKYAYSQDKAMSLEEELADTLRAKGYAVVQH